MARVVVDSLDVVAPRRSSVIFLGVAASAGAVWWVVTSLLSRFVIQPLACRSVATLTSCGDSLVIAGSVAALLVAIAALFVLVTLRHARPLLTVTSSAALLWSLGLYVDGLAWFEGLAWAMILYAVSYALFALVGRIYSVWLAVGTAVVLVLVLRLLVAF